MSSLDEIYLIAEACEIERNMEKNEAAIGTTMRIRKVKVVTDGGPWAMHNHACSVCREKHSVLDLSIGVMLPCWSCQKNGWITSKRTPNMLFSFLRRSAAALKKSP